MTAELAVCYAESFACVLEPERKKEDNGGSEKD